MQRERERERERKKERERKRAREIERERANDMCHEACVTPWLNNTSYYLPMYIPQEAAEGRTAHNVRNGANGMGGESLPQAHPPHLRCHQPPVVHTSSSNKRYFKYRTHKAVAANRMESGWVLCAVVFSLTCMGKGRELLLLLLL
jgi:hypothetical protein